MIDEQGLKRCPRCEVKMPPAGNFYVSRRACGDGFGSYCIPCTKVIATEWQRARTSEEKTAYYAKEHQRRKDTPAYKASAAKTQAARVGNPVAMEKRNAWYAATPEYRARQAELNRQRKKADPQRWRIYRQVAHNTARAKKLGVMPNDFSSSDWSVVLLNFDGRCAFCGGAGLMDIEHLAALSKGGANTIENIVCACRPCNAEKFYKTLDEFAALRGLDAEAIRARARASVDLRNKMLGET